MNNRRKDIRGVQAGAQRIKTSVVARLIFKNIILSLKNEKGNISLKNNLRSKFFINEF